MPDREKVIKGLEEIRDCESIVYKYRLEALEDAIALLKAQEPRVMTLEEALDCNYCWLETHNWKNGDHFIPVLRALAMDDDSGRTFIDQNDDLFGFRDEEYSETVRCWTARPTDEQREATPWQSDIARSAEES